MKRRGDAGRQSRLYHSTAVPMNRTFQPNCLALRERAPRLSTWDNSDARRAWTGNQAEARQRRWPCVATLLGFAKGVMTVEPKSVLWCTQMAVPAEQGPGRALELLCRAAGDRGCASGAVCFSEPQRRPLRHVEPSCELHVSELKKSLCHGRRTDAGIGNSYGESRDRPRNVPRAGLITPKTGCSLPDVGLPCSLVMKCLYGAMPQGGEGGGKHCRSCAFLAQHEAARLCRYSAASVRPQRGLEGATRARQAAGERETREPRYVRRRSASM